MADLKTPLHINMPEKKIVEYDRDIKLFDSDDYIDQYYRKLQMQCMETEESFIFSTIDPFVKSLTDMEISKEELIAAVELIRMRKEAVNRYDFDILSDRIRGAVMLQQLHRVYNTGFFDGYDKAREEAISFLSKKGDSPNER